MAGCIPFGKPPGDPYDRADAALRLPAKNDYSDIPDLISLLEDKDSGVAWAAWHRLVERTGESYGTPRTVESRREAAAAWREWYNRRR